MSELFPQWHQQRYPDIHIFCTSHSSGSCR